MNKEQEEKINPFDFEYPMNHVTEVSSNSLLNVMYFCQKVLESQPKMAVTYAYPDNVKLTRNENGGLKRVDLDWIPYSADDKEAFFASMENVTPIATELSVLSEQVFYAFNAKHSENIEKGFAKKRVELTKEQENESVSSILGQPSKIKE
jgi:hypothetical protein